MPRAASSSKQKVVTELRRSEILAAATRVFGNKGFDATLMDEIARAAGLAKGTLYLYFKSKDEIYQAVVRQSLAELDELTRQEFAKTFDAVDKQFRAMFTRLFGGGSARLSPMPTMPPQHTEMPASRTRSSVSSRSWKVRVVMTLP